MKSNIANIDKENILQITIFGDNLVITLPCLEEFPAISSPSPMTDTLLVAEHTLKHSYHDKQRHNMTWPFGY